MSTKGNARSRATTAKSRNSRKRAPATFPAMFTMAQMHDLEASLQNAESHIPRRMALAVLANDSEQLVERFGKSEETASLLPEQASAIECYISAQLDFVAVLGIARDRIGLTAKRIATERPEFASR